MIFSLGSMNYVGAIPCDTHERDDGKIICVSESTATKLMERGWKLTIMEKTVEYDFPLSSKTNENESNSEPKGWGENFEVKISNLPKIGETAIVTISITNTDVPDFKLNLPHETIAVQITDNFEFVDVPTDKIIIGDGMLHYGVSLDLDQGETQTLSATVKAVKPGMGHLGGAAGDWGFSYWAFVDKEQTILREDYEKLHLPFAAALMASDLNESGQEEEPEPAPPTDEEIEIMMSNRTAQPSIETSSVLYDDTVTVLVKSSEEWEPKDKPFGAYSEILSKQRAPSPSTYDQSTIDKVVEIKDNNILQQASAQANNFSINTSSEPHRGFIINNWVPTTIPSGYELKIATWSGPFEGPVSTIERMGLSYAPVDQILTPKNYTGTVHDIQGFHLGGSYLVSDPDTDDEIQDYIDKLLSYGVWEETTILGKRALVAEGTEEHLTAIKIITNDYEFGGGSYYHTLDELTEILKSIPALQ